MRFVLALSLMVLVSFAIGLFVRTTKIETNQIERNSSTASPTASPTPEIQTDIEAPFFCKDYKQIEIPKNNSAIGKFDFKNFSYPKIWQKGSVKLKNGCFGESAKTALGGCEFTLDSLDFVDFTEDGVEEALVNIGNFCAAGSSSFAQSLFIFEVKNKKLKNLWKLNTGSESYCGVKDYKLEGNKIKLEVYSECAVKTSGKLDDICKGHGDMGARYWTRFIFGWQDNKFGVIKREVFPLS